MSKECKRCRQEILGHNKGIYCDKCVAFFNKKHSLTEQEKQRQDKIKCKICGKWFVLLAAHTSQTHGLTGREYRKLFGYDVKKGLIPEHYRQNRKALVRAHPEVIENIRGKGAALFVKGQTCSYQRSDETIGRLTKQFDGIVCSEKTREKMSKSRKGKHHSKEAKRKMSLARKQYWERKKNE